MYKTNCEEGYTQMHHTAYSFKIVDNDILLYVILILSHVTSRFTVLGAKFITNQSIQKHIITVSKKEESNANYWWKL